MLAPLCAELPPLLLPLLLSSGTVRMVPSGYLRTLTGRICPRTHAREVRCKEAVPLTTAPATSKSIPLAVSCQADPAP